MLSWLWSEEVNKMGDTESKWDLPPKPEEPLQSDCCGMGCLPCVFDRYEEELQLWERECEKIRRGNATTAEHRNTNVSLAQVNFINYS